MRRAPLFVAAALCTTGLLFAPYVLRAQENRLGRTRCAHALRQIGLAAAHYGDDKLFLPHVNATRALDGDASSHHTPQSVRATVWYGYHDDPAGFVCTSSDDYSVTIEDAQVRENLRLWFWSAEKKGDNKTPPWRDALTDPALNKTRQLSYGYTRRGYNRNVSSLKRLFADRAVRDGVEAGPMTGNHDSGWNVANADCSVEFLAYSTAAAKQLTSTERGGGFLALKAQLDDSGFKPIKAGTPPSTQAWSGYYQLKGKRIRVVPRSYDRRAGRWSFTLNTLNSKGEPIDSAYGCVASDGSMTGFAGSPFAKLRAARKGDTLEVSRDGKLEIYTVAEAPLDKVTIELTALSLVGAMHSGNEVAAKAMITQSSLRKLSEGEFDAFVKLAQSKKRRDVQTLMEHFLTSVVKDKDGVVRLNLIALPKPAPTTLADKNEPAAVAALRALSTCQDLFREGDEDKNNVLDYAGSLAALAKTTLKDKALATGVKNGYRFALRRAEGTEGRFRWMVTASPVTPGKTGNRYFATNHSGVIYFSNKPIPMDLKRCEIKGAWSLGH